MRTRHLVRRAWRSPQSSAPTAEASEKSIASPPVGDALVTFRTRGEGICTITPDEFIRRFLLHVLPEQLVKIRHYGLLAPANVSTRLRRAEELLAEQGNAAPSSSTHLADTATDTDGEHHGESTPDPARPRCPRCGSRALILVGTRRTGYRRPRANSPPPDT